MLTSTASYRGAARISRAATSSSIGNHFSLITTTVVEGLDDNQQYARPLQICVERLRYWEAEAPPDVVCAREIIEELMGAAGMDRNYY
jgi:hypothetical protein